MNALKKDIVRYMTDLTAVDERTLTARVTFPEDFIGFQGHFPSGKVLPGVCQVQCVTLLVETYKKRPVILKEIVNAKFISPVLPSEEIMFRCSESNENGDILLKATISKAGSKIAELKLKVSI